MTIDPSLIGASSPAQTFEVEKGAILKLAEAIGDPHPAYRDGRAAPPTSPTTFRKVASVIAFLCSEDASFVSGQVIYVRGGP